MACALGFKQNQNDSFLSFGVCYFVILVISFSEALAGRSSEDYCSEFCRQNL